MHTISDNALKVLHVADAIDPSLGGGTAERTYQLATALNRIGVECTVLCTTSGLGAQRIAELGGVGLVAVPTLSSRFLIPQISLRQIRALVSDADVVHVTGHWSLLGAMVCLMSLYLGRPYVYCPAGSLKIFGRSFLLKTLYNLIVGQRIVRGAARCLAVTDLERQHFKEYGVADSRIEVLPNGVRSDSGDVAQPQDFIKRYALENKKIILFLGRLSPIKGPDLLLQAFAQIESKLDSTCLVFAGPDAELGEQLKSSTIALGLSGKVLFTGFLAGQDKQDALTAANLLVVPSRQEAMSLVALEAGLCGTPVLLTDQCGFDEVQKSDGGMVVPVDIDAIANGMLLMLQNPVHLAEQGRHLRDLVLSTYTWDGLTQHIVSLYRDLKADKLQSAEKG